MSYGPSSTVTEAFAPQTLLSLEDVDQARLETDFVSRGKVLHSFNDKDDEIWETKDGIGSGGFGVVVLEQCTAGDDQAVGKLRAVKRVRRPSARFSGESVNPDGVMLRREILGMLTFSQPRYESHFVKFLGWFSNDQTVYLAMDYMPNGDLGLYLDANGPLPENEVKLITRNVLGALRFMHSNNFAHRDLKPQNILIHSMPPDHWWVKLGDFGLSREFQNSVTFSSGPMGTLGYMAPELLQLMSTGSLSQIERAQKADIWAAGQTVFNLLAARTTFGDDLNAMYRYMHGGTRLETLVQTFMYPLGPVSASGVAFVQSMMTPSPVFRPSVEHVLSDPWIKPLNTYAGYGCRNRMCLKTSTEELRVVPFPNQKKAIVAYLGTGRFQVISLDKPNTQLDEKRFDGRVIRACAISPDGLKIALVVQYSKSAHAKLVWLDALTLNHMTSIKITEPCNEQAMLSMSPDLENVAYGCDDTISLFHNHRWKTTETTCGTGGKITRIRFTPEGDAIHVATTKGIQSRVLPLSRGSVKHFPYPEEGGVGEVSPDCQRAAFASPTTGNVYLWQSELKCWTRSHIIPKRPIRHLGFSSDSSSIVVLTGSSVMSMRVTPFRQQGTMATTLPDPIQGDLFTESKTLVLVQWIPEGVYQVGLFDYGDIDATPPESPAPVPPVPMIVDPPTKHEAKRSRGRKRRRRNSSQEY